MRKKQKNKLSLLKKIALIATIISSIALIFGLLEHYPTTPVINGLNKAPTSEVASKTELDRILFTITVVCGGNVDCKRGLAPLKKSIKYLESRLDVRFKIEKVILSKEKPEGTLEERWTEWLNIASRLGAPKSDLAIILLEDYPDSVDTFDFQQEAILGLATGIGVLGVVPSALLAKVMGSEQFMTRLLTHEIGHVLGGVHIEEGIMHPCACVNQYSDELSHASLNQIKEHLGKVRILRTLKDLGIVPQPIEEPQSKMSEPKAAIIERLSPNCHL